MLEVFISSCAVDQTQSIISKFESWSKMPSPFLIKFFIFFNKIIYFLLLPMTMKSLSSVSLKEIICGVLSSTFGFPPNSGSFASISPKALDTFFDLLIKKLNKNKLQKVFQEKFSKANLY